jgi:hypothetical protein
MRLFRSLGLFVAITYLLWVAALWRWQVTRRDMSVEDIVVYLRALPVTLLVLALLTGLAWHGASARAKAVQAATAAASAPAAGQPGRDPAAHATVQLLAAHVATPAGRSVDELLDAAVQRLEVAGLLFSAARPKGVIPGEAAVALLLAGPQWPRAGEAATPSPHRHRAAIGRRDQPAEAPGRVNGELAGALLRQPLRSARLAPEGVTGLADDADQHSTRSPELFGAMLAQLPQLDATEDQRMAGHLLGRSGAAGTLLAVAMAARRAIATVKPWAALAVGDAHWRLALVARPDVSPPDEPAAAEHAGTNKSST